MNNWVSKRTSCRLCDAIDPTLVMPIGPSPIGDAYVSIDQLGEEQPLFPLDLYQCQACGHVQNLDIVSPELMFREYIYSTSGSASLVEHFRNYADNVMKSFHPAPNSLVLEIGSNDGTLLRFFKDHGMRVQGVDPALNIARQASDSGIPTISEFFTAEIAAKILRDQGPAKLVVANNVFAHADQLADVTKGIATMLDQDGVFVFEVSYLLDIIDNYVFDTVYHEHLSYHSIDPFTRFFSKHGLHLFDIQRNQSKGGSFRGFVQKIDGPQHERKIVREMIEEEARRGLHHPKIFQDYEQRVLARKYEVLECINKFRDEGKSVVGYGASTTVATLMYHFDLFDKLDYLIDDNPKKHGLYSPGCHLEVKPSSVLYNDKPDVVVVLAWQYAKPIINNHQLYIDNGGQFVIPLPDLKIVESIG
jgi:hypothetical protein